jgi:hypothetical protein
MKSKKHQKSIGLVALGLLATLGSGCASAADPEPTGDGHVTPETTSQELRAQLMQALVATPNDEEIIASLRELDHQEAVRFGLIAEVTSPDGHVLQFMEPEPGAVVVTERYDLGDVPAADLTQDVGTLWQTVAPGRSMPPALAKLAQSQLSARAQPVSDVQITESSVDGEPDLAVEEKHTTSSGAHFRDAQNGCALLNKQVERSWCWLNRSGNWSESKSAESTAQVAAAYSGVGLTFTVRVGDRSASMTVLSGQAQGAYGNVGSVCNPLCHHPRKTISGSVSAPTGVNWHWGGSISGNWGAQLVTPWTLDN